MHKEYSLFLPYLQKKGLQHNPVSQLANPAVHEPRRAERFYFKPTKTERILSTTIPSLQSPQRPSHEEQTLLLNKLQLKSNTLTLRLFCVDLHEGASHTYQEHCFCNAAQRNTSSVTEVLETGLISKVLNAVKGKKSLCQKDHGLNNQVVSPLQEIGRTVKES